MNSFVFPIMTDYERQLPFYTKMIALEHPLGCIGRQAEISDSQVILLRTCSAHLLIQNQKLRVLPGQVVLIRAGDVYEWQAETLAQADSIILCGHQSESFLNQPEIAMESGVYQLADPDNIHEAFLQLHGIATNHAVPDPAALSAGVYKLLAKISQQAAANVTGSLQSRYARLKPVLDHIVNHYAESITLKTLSDLLNVTPQHLCTLFRKTMHSRVFEYINLFRIGISKQLLVDGTDRSIRDIAGLVGFDDVSYYCFIFKRFENQTPGEFRKSLSC
jgi:AraC-like DNA-binding protein